MERQHDSINLDMVQCGSENQSMNYTLMILTKASKENRGRQYYMDQKAHAIVGFNYGRKKKHLQYGVFYQSKLDS